MKSEMRICRYITNGIYIYKGYLMAIAIALIMNLLLVLYRELNVDIAKVDSFGAFIYFCFEGCEIIDEASLRLPIRWLFINICVIIIICCNPIYRNGYARYAFVKSENKIIYFFENILLVIIEIVLYYILFFLSGAIFSLFRCGNCNLIVNKEFISAFSGIYIYADITSHDMIRFIVAPLLVNIIIGCACYTIAAFLNNYVAAIIGISIYVITCFCGNNILITNYSMFLRSGILEYGTPRFATLYSVSLILFIIDIIIGMLMITKNDFEIISEQN